MIQDRTCDFKTSRDVQKAYRDGRHQALDVYITIPAGISLEEAERKVRKAIGSIQKGCNDTGTPCPDFEGSVYFNHYGEKEVRRLAINTAGLTQWDEAHYGGPRIDVEPIDVVPIDVFPIRSPMVNITDKTDLSSNELANTGNAIGCITQQEAPQEQAPAGVAASHGERLHAHPAMSSEPQPRIPTSINITEDSGLSNDNPATGAQSTDCNRHDPMRDAAIEATIDEMCGKFGEVAPDPALMDKAMAKILPEGRKKDAPGDGMDEGRGRGGFSR